MTIVSSTQPAGIGTVVRRAGVGRQARCLPLPDAFAARAACPVPDGIARDRRTRRPASSIAGA